MSIATVKPMQESSPFFLPLVRRSMPHPVLTTAIHQTPGKTSQAIIRQRKSSPDSYKGFGQTDHPASSGISEVCVCPVTRIAYVAQNRFAFPCHISCFCHSQARNGMAFFNTLYHLYKIIGHDINNRKREERRE